MENGPKLLKIEPDLFERVWPSCEGLLRRGLAAAPELLGPETRIRIADGTLQLWLVVEMNPARLLAVFFTDINEEPTGEKWVCVHALGGRQMWRWARKLSDGMHSFALAEGCKAIRFAGKKAWGRVLREYSRAGTASNGQPIFERIVA